MFLSRRDCLQTNFVKVKLENFMSHHFAAIKIDSVKRILVGPKLVKLVLLSIAAITWPSLPSSQITATTTIHNNHNLLHQSQPGRRDGLLAALASRPRGDASLGLKSISSAATPLPGSKEEGRARLAGRAVKLGEDGFVAARGQYPLVAAT